MEKENPYIKLAYYILPEEIASSFELVDVQEEGRELHLYLEEKHGLPEGYEKSSLAANGFYETSCIQDFPVRDRRVKLYVRRRRWVEKSSGKSVSKDRELVAHGTRHSKEFAAFLKGLLGEIPDNGPLA
jgi:transposase